MQHSCRVPLLSDAEAWARLPDVDGPRAGPLPGWARALAGALPRTTAATLEVDLVQRTRSPLDMKLRAAVRWVVGRANSSPYGEAYALADLRAAGGDSPESSDPATLEFARKLTLEPAQVTDAEVAALRTLHGDANLVALVQCIAYGNFQDRLVLALGLSVEDGGPLPPVRVQFRKPYAGGTTAQPRTSPGEVPAVAAIPETERVDFDALRAGTEAQKERPARIPVPSIEDVRRAAPTFASDWALRINWSRVCLGYQPELAQAWTNCPRTFASEAHQDPIFEESLFWVVTSSLQCFY
jgi:alkylhydroperoxidase family enzyme